MTGRAARFEVVRTNAGYHARFRAAGNLRIVWTTEVYTRREKAEGGIVAFFWGLDAKGVFIRPDSVLVEFRGGSSVEREVRHLDERVVQS